MSKHRKNHRIAVQNQIASNEADFADEAKNVEATIAMLKSPTKELEFRAHLHALSELADAASMPEEAARFLVVASNVAFFGYKLRLG